MEFIDLAFGIAEISLSAGQLAAGGVAKVSPTHRQCDIEITNSTQGYILSNPRIYMNSGHCASPLPPSIQPKTSGAAAFKKTPFTARGAVGIFTYDLLSVETSKATEQIAILFNVPFNLNLKSNKYAVGILNIAKECNRDLFREMAKSLDTTFVRGKAKGPNLIQESETIKVMASMSDCYTPVMKVEVHDV